MKRDTLFADAGQAPARFEFNEEVAEVFDDMLSRSVPFYSAQQDLFAGLAARFGPPGATVYELGCSTGATLLKLAEAVAPPVRLVGYDYSEAMLKQARSKAGANGLTSRIELRYGDLNSDPRELALEHAGVIVPPAAC